MVVGYDCTNCGYRHECDVNESGERICPNCGDAVTGITGQARGNSDQWKVTYKTPSRTTRTVEVVARTIEDAYNAAQRAGDNVETITKLDRF